MKTIFFAMVSLMFTGSVMAQDRIIPRGQKFCLRDDIGQQYRGCIARKFSNDFYYQATCPNLLDPDSPPSKHLITNEWTVVFEGEPGCEPIVTARRDIPYYVPRSRDDEQTEDPLTDKSESVVRLLFGTNRDVRQSSERVEFTGDRDNQLHLGSIAVSVPKERSLGDVNRPWSLRIPFSRITLGFPEDPEKHFTVRWIGELSEGLFSQQLKEAVENSEENSLRQAFVFIHGYNTSFDAAAFRTAQIAYDLHFPGAPLFFSWPSRGKVGSYEYDQQSARTARTYLAEFLTRVREESNADIVHLIAHSMGNDPLMEALRGLKPLGDNEPPLFNEVILAAPDIDLDLFLDLAEQINGVAEGLTLYANEDDRALGLSKKYAGDVPRAGDLPAVIAEGIDTIDVTAAGSALFSLNHSTYAESGALLNDMRQLFFDRKRPENRPPLRLIESDTGRYWKLPGG